MLIGLNGPPAPLAPCRNCDNLLRVRGALYCEQCLDDVLSLARMAARQKHPSECFCVECMCEAQRHFRRVQAAANKARSMRFSLTDREPPDRPRRA